MEINEIVVGTDGSGWSAAAVRWAAREARRRNAPLRIVLAYEWDWHGGRFGGAPQLREAADHQAETLVSTAVLQAHEAAPDVTVRRAPALGEPVPVLLDAAKGAALLVVGNRGRGGFASLLLGSVGQQVATHAPCPVAVVRGRREVTEGPIVVGADGSPSSDDALGLAFQLAAERGCSVVAVRAHPLPAPPWGTDVPPIVYDSAKRDAAEHDALAEWLAPWREKYPNVKSEALVAHGGAAKVLVDVSHTAQLVVVGSRGHGSIAGTLLSSVGLQLLHHADCPVLVARTPATA
jgi:nucleotide-binding universal stress UspA family protein